MRGPQEVIDYNRVVSAKLREAFTPLCEALLKRVDKITPEMIQAAVNDITMALVGYKASKYDVNAQLPPVVINSQDDQHNIPGLSENEKLYFSSFLKHLNETAVLKPYNFADLLTGKFQNYLWAPQYSNQKDANNHAADTSVIPIGEYGIDPSLLMLITTTILLREVDKLQAEGLEIENAHWDVLSVETLRGRRKAESAQKSNALISVLDTFREGIQSYQATVSSLTAKKINSLDFICILEELTRNNFAQRIAVRIPFSYTLPSIRQGIFFENIYSFQTNSIERLQLSNAFMEYCRSTQDLYKQSRLVVEGKRNPGLLGTGCPISQKQSGYDLIGINYVGKAYLQLFKLIQSTVDLKLLKARICHLELSQPSDAPIKTEKQDEFKIYNIDKVTHDKSWAKVVETIELQQMSDAVLSFWFGQLPINEMPSSEIMGRWFNADPNFDSQIRDQFSNYIDAILQGKFLLCKRTASQTLALIIVLDQFSRNIYRGSPKAYQCDQLAATLAMDAINSGHDQGLPLVARWFMYMPLQHSENIELQEKSVDVFLKLRQDAREHAEQLILDDVVKNASEHRAIIKHFGRFPHRNKIMGRANTPEESDYLSALTPGIYYDATFFNKLVELPKNTVKASKQVGLAKYSIAQKTYVTSALMLLGLAIYTGFDERASKLKAAGLFLLLLAIYNISTRLTSNYQTGVGFFRLAEIQKKADVSSGTQNLKCPYLLHK